MADQMHSSTSSEVGGYVLYADTRQQKGKHRNIDDWLTARGIPFEYRKLDFGDYQRADGFSNISVDTKQDMNEVAGNVGRDHARFVRECVRAAEAGYRLVVLVEERPEFNDMDNIAKWIPGVCRRCRMCVPSSNDRCKRYRAKPMQGETVMRIMRTLESKYGVRWAFCRKRDTARRICEILGVRFEDG